MKCIILEHVTTMVKKLSNLLWTYSLEFLTDKPIYLNVSVLASGPGSRLNCVMALDKMSSVFPQSMDSLLCMNRTDSLNSSFLQSQPWYTLWKTFQVLDVLHPLSSMIPKFTASSSSLIFYAGIPKVIV